jgi:hypothetical protein
MSQNLSPDDFGEPQLEVAGFQLWIHGRQSSNADWLSVTAHCRAAGASVWAQGAFIEVTDIKRFGDQCNTMIRRESKSAELAPVEPNLKIILGIADGLGHIDAYVEITPDYVTQSHTMEFSIDQSYLPQIVKQCSAIVKEYPIRGL